MKTSLLATMAFICAVALPACAGSETIMVTSTPPEAAGPTFNQITTSGRSFSKDCVPTSITVTTNITDPSGIKSVVLWYRVGADQPFKSANMQLSGGEYGATVNASDITGAQYGTLEFYISAEDALGNHSRSLSDTSVQLLACVSS